MACNGLKMGSFHLFRHPKWFGIIFWKNPFLTHFWSQSTPFSRHFGIFRRAKTGHHELKMCQKHLFWHSMWSRIIFERSHLFLHPEDLVDTFWHPPLWATTCSLPQLTGPRYKGLGANHQKWVVDGLGALEIVF